MTPDELTGVTTSQLLICADGGGFNDSRVRAWKIELAAFASDTGLHVSVCHLPPGTSKWNKLSWSLETAQVA